MGHEFSGEVMEVGAQVTSLKLGDRVAGETHYPCGQCYQCQTGEQHICANMRLVGRTLDGCFADYCVLPEICARKIPDCIPSRQAALLEPLGVAVHAVTEAQVWGRPVVILGAGPIGLMAVAAARQLGAAQVIATARTPVKLEKALAMGATAALNPRTEDVVKEVLRATGGVGAGAVIDFTGDPEALVQGFRMLRKGGRVVLVAAFGELSGLDSLRDIIWKGAKITGIHGRRMFDTWILAEGLLVSQSVDVSPVTGSTYPLEGFEAAFAEATGSTGRVLLVP
jgi:threonine 3-dehydrogenase